MTKQNKANKEHENQTVKPDQGEKETSEILNNAEIAEEMNGEVEEVEINEAELVDLDEEEKTSKEPDWKDAYARLAADFDNYRKRSNAEFDAAKRRERERVMNAWLDVYDAAERAIAALPEKCGPWYDGFITLIKQMNQSLAVFKIKPMDSLGEVFDPMYHEAIAIMPQAGAEHNTIIHVEKRGFLYESGEVMRVASVVVAKND
ncbi:MAG: nucleotide exchange factor GrpE [Bradymonadales bacterium]|jgi:molecular chaperone GrpE